MMQTLPHSARHVACLVLLTLASAVVHLPCATAEDLSHEHGLPEAAGEHGDIVIKEDEEDTEMMPAGDGEPSLHEHVAHPEARVIAYIMLLSLAWQMSILWFANYPEPGIRQLAARMVCTAVAVFCAVLVNQAIFSFIFDQVLTGQEGRGLGMKRDEIGMLLTSAIGAGVFSCNLMALNVGCWYYRHQPNKLRAFALVSAHMLAWSGIEAFGNLRLSKQFHNMWRQQVTAGAAPSHLGEQVGFIVIVSCFFSLFFGLAACFRRHLRKRFARDYTSLPQAVDTANEGTENGIPLWLEETEEAEKDSSALVSGFLTMQTLVSLITGAEHVSIHGLHHERQFSEVVSMQASAVTFLLALILVSCVMHSLGKQVGHSIFNFRGYLAMSMAWCCERAGEWTMNLVWKDIWMARIWSAYMLSIFSVMCVLCIKKVVDQTEERLNRKKAFDNIRPEELEDYLYTLNRGTVETNTNASLDEARMQELRSASRQGSVDKLMNTVVGGFSVVIGLVWDMGFEAAEAIIVAPGKVSGPYPLRMAGEWFIEHPVIAKAVLCCLLVAIVVPGWSKHLVSAARKDWQVHLEDIVRAKRLQSVVNLSDSLA